MKYTTILLLLLCVNTYAGEVTCLAKNIYFEARGESVLTQRAVAKVTMNRVYSSDYLNDVCSVVHEGGQFSWAKKSRKITEPAAWKTAHDLAYRIVHKDYDPLPGFSSLWFHDTSVARPSWAYGLKREAVMGPLIFYRR